MSKSEVGKLITDILLTSEEGMERLSALSKNAIHVARENFTRKELDRNEDYQSLVMLTMGLEILGRAVKSQDSVTP
jgi:hypothetical protein